MAKKIKKVEQKELLDVIIEGMQELKAKNIMVMDLRNINGSVADYFVLATGTSSTQVEGICNSVEKFTEEWLMESPRRIEGKRNAKWILMDYFNIIVHIFDEETRSFYALEQLWGDASIREIQD